MYSASQAATPSSQDRRGEQRHLSSPSMSSFSPSALWYSLTTTSTTTTTKHYRHPPHQQQGDDDHQDQQKEQLSSSPSSSPLVTTTPCKTSLRVDTTTVGAIINSNAISTPSTQAMTPESIAGSHHHHHHLIHDANNSSFESTIGTVVLPMSDVPGRRRAHTYSPEESREQPESDGDGVVSGRMMGDVFPPSHLPQNQKADWGIRTLFRESSVHSSHHSNDSATDADDETPYHPSPHHHHHLHHQSSRASAPPPPPPVRHNSGRRLLLEDRPLVVQRSDSLPEQRAPSRLSRKKKQKSAKAFHLPQQQQPQDRSIDDEDGIVTLPVETTAMTPTVTPPSSSSSSPSSSSSSPVALPQSSQQHTGIATERRIPPPITTRTGGGGSCGSDGTRVTSNVRNPTTATTTTATPTYQQHPSRQILRISTNVEADHPTTTAKRILSEVEHDTTATKTTTTPVTSSSSSEGPESSPDRDPHYFGGGGEGTGKNHAVSSSSSRQPPVGTAPAPQSALCQPPPPQQRRHKRRKHRRGATASSFSSASSSSVSPPLPHKHPSYHHRLHQYHPSSSGYYGSGDDTDVSRKSGCGSSSAATVKVATASKRLPTAHGHSSSGGLGGGGSGGVGGTLTKRLKSSFLQPLCSLRTNQLVLLLCTFGFVSVISSVWSNHSMLDEASPSHHRHHHESSASALAVALVEGAPPPASDSSPALSGRGGGRTVKGGLRSVLDQMGGRADGSGATNWKQAADDRHKSHPTERQSSFHGSNNRGNNNDRRSHDNDGKKESSSSDTGKQTKVVKAKSDSNGGSKSKKPSSPSSSSTLSLTKKDAPPKSSPKKKPSSSSSSKRKTDSKLPSDAKNKSRRSSESSSSSNKRSSSSSSGHGKSSSKTPRSTSPPPSSRDRSNRDGKENRSSSALSSSEKVLPPKLAKFAATFRPRPPALLRFVPPPPLVVDDEDDGHKMGISFAPTNLVDVMADSLLFPQEDSAPPEPASAAAASIFPRIINASPHDGGTHHEPRFIQLYPSDFTDNTQYYGVLDSDDEHLLQMELREPYANEECVPMQEWQTTYHPSCNAMHELALDHLGRDNDYAGGMEQDALLFGTKGFWRNAWKVTRQLVLGGGGGAGGGSQRGAVSEASHTSDKTATKPLKEENVVLKTLKFVHNFEDAHFEHDRVDAVAMERLTSSPHVINVFGFCGHSVITEMADGTRVGQLADKAAKKPLERLRIARDIANGLADVHGIDGDGNTTFVHLDINPANVVSVGGTLKLNDFNIGILLRWNVTSNDRQCGFPAQYPNPQWRSPEEARNEQHLTEKVDIFSLGHIFFRLICGHEPWNKLEAGGKPAKEDITRKVQRGVLPALPQTVVETTDPEVAAIRDVMLECYRLDPTTRPTARSIANRLQATLDDLTNSDPARR